MARNDDNHRTHIKRRIFQKALDIKRPQEDADMGFNFINAYACFSILRRQACLTNKKTAQRAKEGKMYVAGFILSFMGLISCSSAIILIYGNGKENLSIREDIGILLIITTFAFGALGTGIMTRDVKTGKPKTSIDAGTYTIVGYVEVSKDKQPYYQMILEQEGEVKLYTLPKDMIIMDKTGTRRGIIEVIEKSGLRKATLYPPTPGGQNPFP